ncbi:class II SORL domain-containing protein [Thermogladius sp. 4427co]|uniref:class II SORL domain-containing protein n=1 Tax=Thermogladius sp. 4427co TaxID=3450718 RepID=UPI003F7AC320
MSELGSLIYTPQKASGEAISKVESHTPRIIAPDRVGKNTLFKVRVEVGPHPNTVEHSIRWIELYFKEEGRSFNPVFLGRFLLEPVYAEPSVEVSLKLSRSGKLIALAYCNLHGLWESSKDIVVE